MAKTKKAANGAGTIRKKTVTRGGRTYTFWEARYTAGYDPGSGRQIQRSISGRTQRDVSEQLKAITSSIDAGTYQEPSKITVLQWMEEWLNTYVENSVKPFTFITYRQTIRNHIGPHLGAIPLQGLRGNHIQRFYNDLTREGLCGKTVKNIGAVLHHALKRAVKLGYIPANPCDAADLPRVIHKEIHPLKDEEIKLFLSAIEGTRYRNAFAVCLFCGLREGELLGLSWDRINFERKEITVCQQLQRGKVKGEVYTIQNYTKSGRPRTIKPPAITFDYLKAEQIAQAERRLRAGSAWSNEWNLVFTNDLGRYVAVHSFYKAYKEVVTSIGRPDARPHDLRHTCATAAIAAGADVKSVQDLMGHATAAFTLDKYAHTSEKMKQDTADRLQAYYAALNG